MEAKWSETRIKTLRECPRKYYYQYFLSDKGWMRHVSDECKKAYMLKKMTNLYMFAGSVVHDIIESMIVDKNFNIGYAKSEAEKRFNQGVNDSKNKKWKSDPSKSINLFEHYYNRHYDINFFVNRIQKCLDALFSSKIFSYITTMDDNDKISIEQFQSFDLKTDASVSVKIDFAIRVKDKVYIIDWKTGKNNPGIKEQLITYAMYAMKNKWAKKVEDIVIVPVFLAEQDSNLVEVPIKFDMQDLIRQANIITREFPLITKAEKNRNNPKAFPVTQNTRLCDNCNFREICDGANR